jgi:hypothetical protein
MPSPIVVAPLPEVLGAASQHVDLAAIGSVDEIDVEGGVEVLSVVLLKRVRSAVRDGH